MKNIANTVGVWYAEEDHTYTRNTFALAHQRVVNMGRMWQNREQEFKDLSGTVAAGMHNRACRSTAAERRPGAPEGQDLVPPSPRREFVAKILSQYT